MEEWESIGIVRGRCRAITVIINAPKDVIFIFTLKTDTLRSHTHTHKAYTHSRKVKQSILGFYKRKRLTIPHLLLNEQWKAPQKCSVMQP